MIKTSDNKYEIYVIYQWWNTPIENGSGSIILKCATPELDTVYAIEQAVGVIANHLGVKVVIIQSWRTLNSRENQEKNDYQIAITTPEGVR